MMTGPTIHLTRDQVLAHRRRESCLDERLAPGADALRRAAWGGLSDSMPRGALLSLHARVAGVGPGDWEDPAFEQVWGPRFSAYVVPARDRAVFTLGRLPPDARRAAEFEATADLLEAFLDGRRMQYGQAGRGLGVNHNALRYAAPTGRVLIRWDGARQPTVWCVPRPAMTPSAARLELVRRYLHLLGPGTVDGFVRWAGVRAPGARSALGLLDSAGALVRARTPVGEGWILAEDEASFRSPSSLSASSSPAEDGAPVVRLLPSGDIYWLLHGSERDLLVPDPARRPLLWTPRVWPGALLLDGEIAGTWRRAGRVVDLQPWRRFTDTERVAVEAEASTLPIPEQSEGMVLRWAP